MIKVFGHKSPDTDSTGSAIIWAWYLKEIQGRDATAHVLGIPNMETRFVLERWNLEIPPFLDSLKAGDKVFIVDTNNPGELPDGIADATIVGIIDHHLLTGGLVTRIPIEVTIWPLACTATVMYKLMEDHARSAPAAIKGLMLSCIISDTMAFRSPTTTDTDRAIAQELAEDLGIDMDAYAEEMFAAKSDISGYSDFELMQIDAKLYEIKGRKLRISVLETTAPEQILARKEGLLNAIDDEITNGIVDQVLLFVVDIINESATLLLPNPEVREIAQRSFNVTASGDNVVLPGIVSRKKQIIPQLDC